QISEVYGLPRAHPRIECRPVFPEVTAMPTRCCLILGVCGALQAQQAMAPTTEPVGSPRGETRGDYNVTQSFETGYRWNRVFGSADECRSDANYGSGIRLLGTSLSVNSKDGHGR